MLCACAWRVLCFSPFTTRTENRYDASEACVFAGDFGVGGDFAVVCLNIRIATGKAPQTSAARRNRRAGKPHPYERLSDGRGAEN